MLEEMPPFPERESSILAKLKKKQPGKLKETMEPREVKVSSNHTTDTTHTAAAEVGGSNRQRLCLS